MSKNVKVVFTFENAKGVDKTVSVFVDEKLMKKLDSLSDEKFKTKYLTDIYHEFERERWRRRKHGSNQEIDEARIVSTDAPFFIPKKANIIFYAIKEHRTDFTDDQLWLIDELYIKGRKIVDIAREEGVYESAIRNRRDRIIKKIKKQKNISIRGAIFEFSLLYK